MILRKVMAIAAVAAGVWLIGCTTMSTTVKDPVAAGTELPAPRPLDGQPLPGSAPQHADQLETRWYGQNTQQDADLRSGREPRLDSSIHLWLREEGRYELVYQARWGVSPNRNESGYRGVDVRESGRYTLTGDTLHLEPATTEFTQLSGGNSNTQTISGEKRSYVVHVDRRYLNVAGRCASYQVDPVCKEAKDVWFSLAASNAWPDDTG